MKIALTGASGLVGRWIAGAARQAGHQVDPLSGWRLGQAVDLGGCDALIHAAFQHVPGRYRGGEGDDPQGFIRTNLDGSLALFRAAQSQGVPRVVFLSSRAVHDGHPAGMDLADDLSPWPTSLYGQVKAQAEAALAAMHAPGFRTASLRPTGIYGPGQPQKWAALITDFLSGVTPSPHVSTEVHGNDLARAVLTVLTDPQMGGSYNVGDLVLDRRDLLAEVAALTGCTTPLPARADSAPLRRPVSARLWALGWAGGGLPILRADLPGIVTNSQP